MAIELTEDLRLTHAYLNSLNAGLQGSYAASNVLGQLGYARLAPEPITELKEALDWVGARGQEMWRGVPVLLKSDDDEEAARLLALFDRFRSRLIDFIASFMTSLWVIRDAADRESAAYVVAGLARHAYARQHFVRGLVRFGEAFGQVEVADRWRQQTLSCQRGVGEANQLLERLEQEPTPDQGSCGEIWNSAASLPGVFRTQLLDLCEIEAMRGLALTFERAGIEAAEAERWRALGVEARTAGRWAAFDATPEEAAAWVAAGLGRDPMVAGSWKSRDFDPPTAAAWHAAGLPPDEAYRYRRAGVEDPRRAAVLRAQRQA